MTFDQAVLLWCGLAPAAITFAAVLLGQFLCGRQEVLTSRRRLATGFVAVGWCTAVGIAISIKQGWSWTSAEAWQLGLGPVLGWACWTAFLDEKADRAGPWVVAGILAMWTAAVAMPWGENWEDTYPLHRVWMAAISISCLLNVRAIQWMSAQGADRWLPLIALAALGGPTILAASTYASLAEFGLAAIVATSVVAVIGVTARGPRLSLVAVPVIAVAANMAAAGRFYSYEEHPTAIYAAMLLLPTWVAAADWPIRYRSNWLRASLAALVAAAIVAACLWFILLRETDTW